MKKNLHFKSSGGFTLIELLVVITILGILMSLAVSGSGAIRNQARSAQARNDCTSLSTSIRAFYTDYSRYPVPTAGSALEVYEPQQDSAGNGDVIKALIAQDAIINPREVVYYENKTAKQSDGVWKSGIAPKDSGYGLFDPWGYTYGICMNINSKPDFRYTGSALRYYNSKMGDVQDDVWQPISSGLGVFSLGKDQCSDKRSSSPAPGIMSWY
jgi:general secretion pathway protein G